MHPIIFNKIRHLTPQETKFLYIAIKLDQFTNKDISDALKIAPANVSRIIQTLSKDNFIYPIRQEGKKIYFSIKEELRILADTSLQKTKIKNKIKTILLSSKEKRQQQLLAKIKTSKKITAKEYQELGNVSLPTAQRDLRDLTQQKKIKKIGQGPSTFYTS